MIEALDMSPAERLLEMIRRAAEPQLQLAPNFYGHIYVSIYVRAGRPHGLIKIRSEISIPEEKNGAENGNRL